MIKIAQFRYKYGYFVADYFGAFQKDLIYLEWDLIVGGKDLKLCENGLNNCGKECNFGQSFVL